MGHLYFAEGPLVNPIIPLPHIFVLSTACHSDQLLRKGEPVSQLPLKFSLGEPSVLSPTLTSESWLLTLLIQMKEPPAAFILALFALVFLSSVANAQDSAGLLSKAISSLKTHPSSTQLANAIEEVEAKNLPAARQAFQQLAADPQFPVWMSNAVEQHSVEIVPAVLTAIGNAYSGDSSFFEEGEDGLKVLEAMAASPRCVWKMYDRLPHFDWGSPMLADSILADFENVLLREQPERVYEFLRFSPLISDIPEFDPGPFNLQNYSLLERLLRYFASSKKQAAELVQLLRKIPEPGFGCQLAISFLKDPEKSDLNVALFFEANMHDVENAPGYIEANLIGIATRLAVGAANLERDDLHHFKKWLADYDITSMMLQLVDEMLAAKTWEELYLHPHPSISTQTVIKLLVVQIPEDPQRARELIFHVSKLYAEAQDPAAYANWSSSLGDAIVSSLSSQTSSNMERVIFCLNTFVDGEGKVGFSYRNALASRIGNYLVEPLGARMPLDPRYDEFHQRVRALAKDLHPDAVPLMIDGFRNLTNRLPFNDVRANEMYDRVRIENSKANSDIETALFDQLETAIRMRFQKLKSVIPEDANGLDLPYLTALRDMEKPLSWRYALACSLLNEEHGLRTEELTIEGLKTLIEHYESFRHVNKYDELQIVKAAHLRLDTGKNEALFQEYLDAWEKRYLTGQASIHQNEQLSRMIQIALELDREEFAYTVVKKWEGVQRQPHLLIAALNSGCVRMTVETFKKNREFYNTAPNAITKGPRFSESAAKFLKEIAETDDPNYLLARVLLHLAPGGKADEIEKEGREIATILGKSFDHSETADFIPTLIEKAILLMAQAEKPPVELQAAIEKWFQLQEPGEIIAGEPYETGAKRKAMLLHAKWHISKLTGRKTSDVRTLIEAATGASQTAEKRIVRGRSTAWKWAQSRNEFLDELLTFTASSFRASVATSEEISPEKYEEWIEIFKVFSEIPKATWTSSRGGEIYNLVSASALAGRCEELNPWFRALPPEHQAFLTSVASTGLNNVLRVTAKIGQDAPSMRDDMQKRMEFAAEILRSPFPHRSVNFVKEWTYRGMANHDQMLKWADTLTEGTAIRRGNTAMFLSRLAREKKQPDLALKLIDRALALERPYNFDLIIFTIYKGEILVEAGKKDEAIELIKAAMKTPNLSADLNRRGNEALQKFQNAN